MTVDGRTWTLTGDHERATYRFSEVGRTQEISWQWKPAEEWLPAVRPDCEAHRLTAPTTPQ